MRVAFVYYTANTLTEGKPTMGKFRDWLFGPKAEEEQGSVADEPYNSGFGYGSPGLGGHYLDTDYDYAEPDDYLDTDYNYAEPDDDDEPDEITSDELVPGWKRKGRPYVHFRTLKLVDRDGGWKFKVHGRSGKPRHKSELYTLKSNAKRAAIAFAKKSAIPTRFVDDQYDGQVVYDTNAQDA